VFQGVRGYVHGVRENFVQRRLANEMPALFANLASQIASASRRNGGHAAHADTEARVISENDLAGMSDSTANGAAGDADSLSMYCAARVGLETIRIWKQLNLHIAQPTLYKPIDEFQALLTATLATQKLPSSHDAAAQSVYRAASSTVVLFFDHLQHDTPEDHVEAQSRVLTCLKMLTDHLVDEPPHAMEVEGDADNGVPKRAVRSMQLLNCNDILAPPVWCLPLAHSPQYLAQLWRLAEEAHSGDLYVPLEFDTEWISEDPYRSGSDDEGMKRARTPAPTGNLMRSVEFEEPWYNALEGLEKDAFTKLLTPVPTDHLVARVIKRMESRAAAKALRAAKPAALPRSRQDERSASTSSLPALTQPLTPAPVVMRPEMDGAAVKTPMGAGTIVVNYRRDGMVSVKLSWGAVGHFRKECIEFPPAPVGPNSQNKVERPSSSSAQAFYVSGSAGRFVYNDMELHNTMCRLISLARVQRVIGDCVAINHANLSLYMHGRTSSGLTRTIEATIARWLEKFDEHKLAALLDFAETEALRGAPIEPKEFMRLLQETAMPPGQVSTVRCDRSLGRPVGLVPARGDAPLSLPKPSKPTVQPSSIQPPTAKPAVDVVSVPASPAMHADIAQSPVKVKQERHKSATDVRTLPKYSKDGEILRELMSSIMRTLKLSQGSIANEYYRCFRYETSQGGVSAWFHFRGNSVTFEGMNHCALMWVDDHKKHLTLEEQKIFAGVNTRMSQASPKHAERTGALHDPTCDDMPMSEVGLGESASMASFADESEPSGAAASALSQSAETASESIVWADVEPLPLTAGDEGLPASSAEPVEPETPAEQSAAYEADGALAVEEDDVLSADDAGDVADGEDTASESAEEVDDAGNTGDADQADNDSFAMEVDSVPASEPVPTRAPELCAVSPATPSSAETSHTRSALASGSALMQLASGHVAGSISGEPSATNGLQEVKTEDDVPVATPVAVPEDTAAPHGTIRTIEDLHKTVVYEMARRKVSQSRAAVEANLKELGMGQPALSKFLSVATINNNERGKLFSGGMIK
jgi:hypothetical protein